MIHLAEPVCTLGVAPDDGFDPVTGPGQLWEHPAVTAAREATALPCWWPFGAAAVLVGTIAASALLVGPGWLP